MSAKPKIPNERSAKVMGLFWVLEAVIVIAVLVAKFVLGLF